MNTYALILSSASTSHSVVREEQYLEDISTMTLNLSGIDESVTPLYLKIDWGDGAVEHFDNELYKNYRTTSIYPEVLAGKFSEVLQNTYQHTYGPSPTSLYRSLTAQVIVEYSDGNYNWFILPFKIRTYDFFESIYDLKLVNTNILPYGGNPKEHQFVTDAGGFVIETRNDA